MGGGVSAFQGQVGLVCASNISGDAPLPYIPAKRAGKEWSASRGGGRREHRVLCAFQQLKMPEEEEFYGNYGN